MKKPIDVHLTPEGLEKLKLEIESLTSKRPKVVTRMAAAREQGDLSENAGYHAAKEELGHIDHRLRELKLITRFATIIEPSTNYQVSLGNTVVVKDGQSTKEFRIVGKLETDPKSGKISDDSPIGKALLGKKVHENVEIETPNGIIKMEIISIKSQ